MAAEEREDRDLNQDPLTGEPGAHPVGTGVGAAGGLAGKSAAERINPTAEDTYWRGNYEREPYYEAGRTFDDYAPAYRLGMTGRTQYGDSWTSVEPRLASEWESTNGNSVLNWSQASRASRAAWDRVDMQLRDSGAGTGMRSAETRASGSAGMVGAIQSAGDKSGDTGDVIDALKDLAECSLDGEYGFRECAQHARREDLRAIFLQRADDCRRGAQELNDMIRSLGGTAEEGGSTMGALHRGWVSVKSRLTGYDDKAILEECERGEDNAKTRYRKALQKPMPAHVKQMVERQMQGVMRNHDQIRMLRDQMRGA